jgi:hypothetical protein
MQDNTNETEMSKTIITPKNMCRIVGHIGYTY